MVNFDSFYVESWFFQMICLYNFNGTIKKDRTLFNIGSSPKALLNTFIDFYLTFCTPFTNAVFPKISNKMSLGNISPILIILKWQCFQFKSLEKLYEKFIPLLNSHYIFWFVTYLQTYQAAHFPPTDPHCCTEV